MIGLCHNAAPIIPESVSLLPSGLERSLLPIICPQGLGGSGQTRGVERELLVNNPQVGPGRKGAEEEFDYTNSALSARSGCLQPALDPPRISALAGLPKARP